MSYQKQKLRKKFTYNYIKKNKIPRNKFNSGDDNICTLKTIKDC